MAALTKSRLSPARHGRKWDYLVGAGAIGFAGGIACLEGGAIVSGKTATDLVTVGRINDDFNNANGAAGAFTVTVEPGVFGFDNSANADLIAAVNIGSVCYLVDDHTVALTNGGGGGAATRSVAGMIVDVDANFVWVRLGLLPGIVE